MPLVSMVSELKKAQAGRYAVLLFNTFEMKGFEGHQTPLYKFYNSCNQIYKTLSNK